MFVTTTVALALLLSPAGDTIDVPDLNGSLQEDDPGWDCRGGDRMCGPGSDDAGHTPGCYDDAARLVALWPCTIVVNADGSSDVFTPDARS